MAAQVSQLLARLRRDPLAGLPIGERVSQLLAEHKVAWRDRLLPPLVTLRLFLTQVAHGNCAIAALRQLAGVDFAASSYCEARGRLPLQLLQSLLQWVQELGEQSAAAGARLARRVLIVDGSTFSTPDAPALAAHFDLPPGTRPGVGYPMGKLLGLLDAATGMFVSLLALPLYEHDARSGVRVHAMLRAGDVLLGDRAFCGFAHFALLQARGVMACARLNARRRDQAPGRQRWRKSRTRPGWIDAAQYAALPAFVDVRVVAYAVAHNGYRTRRVLVATTLTDRAVWPDARVAELYGHRWRVETCFGHLKTTMGMNALRCKTLDGVTKELAVYLAVYNLIRLVMLRAAAAQRVDAARVSFVDAMRLLAARMVGLAGVARLVVNPDRAGRSQLRQIRTRYKGYDLLTRSRREQEAEIRRKRAECP